ncbi:MAG: hypothetical protein A2091_11830 [Desulfuromonadales bacterium GWD2_61_12]|nr:MAG: hypothetical protein A2091_11830 [Desulfuromonadales bacterium GWD2_61_12]HAD04277.1 hypothetical protein [Desulfuromonas sp.]
MKISLWLLLALLLFGAACSLPPDRPVTRSALMATRIYSIYVIEESPEEVMNALNTRGEAILEAKRKIQGKEYPVHIKLLATSAGIEVLDYDR